MQFASIRPVSFIFVHKPPRSFELIAFTIWAIVVLTTRSGAKAANVCPSTSSATRSFRVATEATNRRWFAVQSRFRSTCNGCFPTTTSTVRSDAATDDVDRRRSCVRAETVVVTEVTKKRAKCVVSLPPSFDATHLFFTINFPPHRMSCAKNAAASAQVERNAWPSFDIQSVISLVVVIRCRHTADIEHATASQRMSTKKNEKTNKKRSGQACLVQIDETFKCGKFP